MAVDELRSELFAAVLERRKKLHTGRAASVEEYQIISIAEKMEERAMNSRREKLDRPSDS